MHCTRHLGHYLVQYGASCYMTLHHDYALGPYLICSTSSSGNYLSTVEMDENLMELIKNAANFLDYENQRPN